MRSYPLNHLLLIVCVTFGIVPKTCAAFYPQNSNKTSTDPTDGPVPSGPSEAVAKALLEAGDNQAQLVQARNRIADSQRESLDFLIANMPTRDLQSLTADYLLEHVRIAHEAWQAAKWRDSTPKDTFLNEILPYACVNESRDNVRRMLRTRFWPMVQDMDSPSSATAMLNQAVFRELGVKYSTKRRRADQGPAETMESGLASCTGLSILLINACRACGIPARFVGTPLWSDNSGNHSWVEIWDDGWQFTGAAEPTGDQLNQGWFVQRAAQATPGKHGIFAASFARTNVAFPMVWSNEQEVWAEEITERYAAKPTQSSTPKNIVRFRVLNGTNNDRCVANLEIVNQNGQVVFQGQTRDESSDLNDHLETDLEPGSYRVRFRTAEGKSRESDLNVTEGEQLVTLDVDESDSAAEMSNADSSPLTELRNLISLPAFSLKQVTTSKYSEVALSRSESEQATQLLLQAYREQLKSKRLEEHTNRELAIDNLTMRYAVKTFGKTPENGHSLIISMHGGGGAPARVNDQQWENQKRLYELDEGLYVVPRAPTDTWNLWHQAHIDSFFERLIENMIALEGVNPNRVYITGYSAGGDGVFQLAPRMADQLAAAAMMAGHPNETQPDGLRNLPFTLHMGELDAAYERNQKAVQWKTMLAELKESDPNGYVHWVEIHSGKKHWMDGDDAAGVRWLAQFERNPNPDKIVWLQDDVTHDRYYWLASESLSERKRIVARHSGQRFDLDVWESDDVTLCLRDTMVDLDQPIQVFVEGELRFEGKVNRTLGDLARSIDGRCDPYSMYSAIIRIEK